ncbi:MAG: PKD domain-containing protein [Bacteroidales bacterium]|nr:PKD domain-containing protein [Bacteroidales bacterium]
MNLTYHFLRILVVAIFSIISMSAFSQIAMEKVLLEMGTATWSYNSAQEVELIEAMKENGLNISVINYHLNDSYSNQAGNQRANYYSIQNIPFPIIGGKIVIAGSDFSYNEAYDEAINTLSSFSISSTGSFLEDTLFLDVYIEKLADYESDSISLYIALTESNIEQEWFGLSKVDEVERIMTPDGNGMDIDFTENSTIHLQKKILFNNSWNPENMEMLVFLQNDTSKQVLQCHTQDIINFAPLPVHAFFNVTDTISCEKSMVSFQNQSIGNIENTHWIFSGGSPSESTQINPDIQYLDAGNYTVSLAVSNSISTDTLVVPDYIHINPVPDLSFEVFDDFCHNQTTHLLTEGSPIGGAYFGLFVDTGYFHPEMAGVGTHEIYYTYEYESTHCADTISQLAQVFLCDLLNEPRNNFKDFPFIITKNNQQIQLNLKEGNTLHITDIHIFDISGHLLYHNTVTPIHRKTYTFPLNTDNPFLIFRVTTIESIFIIKLQF